MMRWRFQAYGQGKVPETVRTRQKRAEGLYGGAAKRCYGKSCCSIKTLTLAFSQEMEAFCSEKNIERCLHPDQFHLI